MFPYKHIDGVRMELFSASFGYYIAIQIKENCLIW